MSHSVMTKGCKAAPYKQTSSECLKARLTFKCHSEQNCWIHVERKKEFVVFREIVQHGVLVQWVVPECRRNKYQRNPQPFNSHNQQRSKADTVSPLRVRTVPPYALDFARKGRHENSPGPGRMVHPPIQLASTTYDMALFIGLFAEQ